MKLECYLLAPGNYSLRLREQERGNDIEARTWELKPDERLLSFRLPGRVSCKLVLEAKN